ncbi:hypothetical protein STEG23_002709 [Scotinomys teguina]
MEGDSQASHCDQRCSHGTPQLQKPDSVTQIQQTKHPDHGSGKQTGKAPQPWGKLSQRQHQTLKICTKRSVFRTVLKDAVKLSGMEPDKPGLAQPPAQTKSKGTEVTDFRNQWLESKSNFESEKHIGFKMGFSAALQ